MYLKKYKVYNTLCPANSYNANLGRTILYVLQIAIILI